MDGRVLDSYVCTVLGREKATQGLLVVDVVELCIVPPKFAVATLPFPVESGGFDEPDASLIILVNAAAEAPIHVLEAVEDCGRDAHPSRVRCDDDSTQERRSDGTDDCRSDAVAVEKGLPRLSLFFGGGQIRDIVDLVEEAPHGVWREP